MGFRRLSAAPHASSGRAALNRLLGVLLLLAAAAPAAAQRLPQIATPEHYDLALTVDIPGRRFHGTEVIRVRILRPTTRIVLNAADIDFHEVTIDAGPTVQRAAVSVDAKAETATLAVSEPLAAGPAEIHIRYTGVLGNRLRGFYVSRANGREYAVTQLESTDARRTFPSFDEPAYKATFAVTLTIADGDIAISNGRVLSDTPGPGAGQHTVRFSTSPRMSTYLVALAVGDFECLRGGAEGVPIRVCTVPGKTPLARIALETTEQMLPFFNAYHTIKYPFGKLDMVAIPDFAASAMENTAAIFYREDALLADATASVEVRKDIAATIAHELAHQWFGNLVTMEWWDDLWLNEGFATWMETRPLAAAKPEWNLALDEARATQTALDLDSVRSTRPIKTPASTPDEIEGLFDAVAYQKGAAVLRMVEEFVGPDVFQTAVNAYLAAHAYGNATSADLWNAVAAASGAPIDRILPTFITQPGVPMVDLSPLSCQASGETRTTFSQERFLLDPAAPTGAGITWHVPVCLKAPGSAPACVVVDERRETTGVAPGCATWIFANEGAHGYYRTDYTPEVLRALAPRVLDELTPPERLALLGNEWALVRAHRHNAADYLTLAEGYAREPSSVILTDLVERLELIHDYLTPDSARARLAAFVRSLLRPQLDLLGFPTLREGGDERQARWAVLVDALGRFGDPDVGRWARTALEQAVGPAGDGTLAPALRDSVARIAARSGDARLFDLVTAAVRGASSPAEREFHLRATTAFREAALIDRALERSLSNEIRPQETARYLAAFFDNPAARGRAWSFVKNNWSALEPRLRSGSAARTLTRAFGSFCDARSRDDIRAFVTKARLPGTTGTLNQSIQRINRCIDLREAQLQPVAAWLAAR
jgi:aminopeptidase N